MSSGNDARKQIENVKKILLEIVITDFKFSNEAKEKVLQAIGWLDSI